MGSTTKLTTKSTTDGSPEGGTTSTTPVISVTTDDDKARSSSLVSGKIGATPRKVPEGGWTPAEDDILCSAVAQHGLGRGVWKKIA